MCLPVPALLQYMVTTEASKNDYDFEMVGPRGTGACGQQGLCECLHRVGCTVLLSVDKERKTDIISGIVYWGAS